MFPEASIWPWPRVLPPSVSVTVPVGGTTALGVVTEMVNAASAFGFPGAAGPSRTVTLGPVRTSVVSAAVLLPGTVSAWSMLTLAVSIAWPAAANRAAMKACRSSPGARAPALMVTAFDPESKTRPGLESAATYCAPEGSISLRNTFVATSGRLLIMSTV